MKQRKIYYAVFSIALFWLFDFTDVVGQDELNAKYQKAYELVKQNQTTESLQLLDEVMQMNSYLENVYAMYAFNYMLKGNIGEAMNYLQQVEDMGEVTLYPVFMQANLKVFQGLIAEAKALVKRALQYQEMEEDIKDINDAWDTFIKYGKHADEFREMKSWFAGVSIDNSHHANALKHYLEALEKAKSGKNQEAINTFNQAVDALNQLQPKAVNTIYKWQAELGATLYYNGYVEAGGQLLKNTYLNIVNQTSIGDYVKTISGYYYSDYLKYVGDQNQSLAVIDLSLIHI